MAKTNEKTMEEKDLKITFTRGSGPGGQHKNKVETCVVITHVPTGLSERCQDSRSREQNLKLAKERLAKKIEEAKLMEKEKTKNKKRLFLIKNPKTIRTYNFARNEVVDHRTGKRFNLKKFMDGKLNLNK